MIGLRIERAQLDRADQALLTLTGSRNGFTQAELASIASTAGLTYQGAVARLERIAAIPAMKLAFDGDDIYGFRREYVLAGALIVAAVLPELP